MQAELEQTYPRLGTIYSLCSVYYPNIRQRSDVLNRRNFLKTGFYEGIKFWHEFVARSDGSICEDVFEPVRAAPAEKQSFLHQPPEVTLERTALNSWAQMLELANGNSAVLQHMTKGEYLSIRQVVSASEDILLNRQLSSPLNLCELSGKADGEEFDPTRHVHICLSYALRAR